MTDNIIDLNQKRAQKSKRIISPKKVYKISGSLVILLLKFARFIVNKDCLRTDDEKMQAVGYMGTLTYNILQEKFEEVEPSP